MWGPGVEKSLDAAGFDAEVAAFEKAHGCRVVRLSAGAGHMDSQKLSTSIAGGVPPSLVRQGRFNIGDFASRDAFQPLDGLIARDRNAPNGVRKEEYYSAAWNEAVYRGRVYAIPDNVDDRALYYNRALFKAAGLDPDRPPRTWDELKAMAVKLTRRDEGGRITQIGFIPNYGNSWLYLYSWQNGGEFLSPDGRTCTLDNPYTVEALAYMKGVYSSLGGVQQVDAFASSFSGDALDPFLTGKVAMKVDGNWSLSTILRYNPTMDFAVAPAPSPAARVRGEGRFRGQPPYVTWAGGFSWVIPRGVKGAERELAWEWIKWDESLEGQRIRYAAQARAWALVGRKEMPELRANRVVTAALMKEFAPRRARFRRAAAVFQGLMNHCYYRPVTFVGQRLWDEHVRAMEFAVRGQDPKAALSAGRRAVQKELDKAYSRQRFRELPRSAYIALGALAVALLLGAAGWAIVATRRLGRNGRSEALAAYLFAAPWIIGFAVFTLGPILASVLLSFCDYDVLHAPRWLGLQNYRELLNIRDDGATVLKSFQNVLFMSGFGIPLSMLASLSIALLLNAKVKGMRWYRTAYYLPSITPVVANAILWIWLLNPTYGLINHAWAATLTRWFGAAPPMWLSDEHWAKPAFILMGLWGAGGGMILWLAGLQGVPQHLYEAAELDGAGPWARFRHVMLPLLTPTIFFLAVMGVIGSLQMFEVAYIMRGGEALGSPADSTMMPVVLLFQNAFQYFKMGYASALAWVLFVFILAITLLQLRLSRRWVHYGD
jgi:multiple sugar transport system permease protein